jgi:hypothetical protein
MSSAIASVARRVVVNCVSSVPAAQPRLAQMVRDDNTGSIGDLVQGNRNVSTSA